MQKELKLSLTDNEWEFCGVTHDREIVRAIVFDDEGAFYFVRADRDDDFGRATYIETAGGGVEDGEEHTQAILRELSEELGADAEIICKLGVVDDYYNLIHRHNINNYYLCRAISFGKTHMTDEEISNFHLTVARLSPKEALAQYEAQRTTALARLVSNREKPILERAIEVFNAYRRGDTI